MSDPSSAMFHKTTSGNVKKSELINSGRDTTVQKSYNFNLAVFPDVISFIQFAAQHFVAWTRSADGQERDPVDIRDIVPPDPSSLPVFSIADMYTRTMLECRVGYPLYEPVPFSQLSKEYLRNGINVGDVGFVRQDGAFDFLFNICPPQNDVINPPSLPDGFSLGTPEHSETRAMRPLSRETCFLPRTVKITESGEYICDGSEGAILELPEGAIQDEAVHTKVFEDLAKLHGVQWYEYTMTRGRSISNGSLYLVTSFTKCTQWGIAVFDRPCDPGQGLTFVSSPFGWKGSRIFTTKVADPNEDTPNQCVFLRGYKIMIRQDIFDNLPVRRPAQRIRGGGGSDFFSRILTGGNPLARTTGSTVKKSDEVVLRANFISSPVHPSDVINAALLSQNPDAKIALTHDDVWCDLLRDNFPKPNYVTLINIARLYTSAIDEYGCVSLGKISDLSNVLNESSSPVRGTETPALQESKASTGYETGIEPASIPVEETPLELLHQNSSFRKAVAKVKQKALPRPSHSRVSPKGLFERAEEPASIPVAETSLELTRQPSSVRKAVAEVKTKAFPRPSHSRVPAKGLFEKAESPEYLPALGTTGKPKIDDKNRSGEIKDDLGEPLLAGRLRVNSVQFGILFRENYPSSDQEGLPPRSFSIEWEHDAVKGKAAWLDFKYDHKLICITIGDESMERTGHAISIQLGNIERIETGYDPNPYVCFDTITSPDVHEINFHYKPDDQKNSTKVASVHPGHEIVAPYAHNVRIVLFNDRKKNIIEKFKKMCTIAEIPDATIVHWNSINTMKARKCEFFTSERIYKLKKQVASFSWPVAFQLKVLLHNSLLHSGDIENILPTVKRLCSLYPDDNNSYVGFILRLYANVLRMRSPRESPAQCFERVCRDYLRLKSKLSNGIFMCYHVIFTPSRILLEGPYPMQSNRIIREYEGYEDCFIHVNFSEDRLDYRRDRRVDCFTLIEKRVGNILKSGFELAGRRFEFLAYSISSLRNHSVWFVHPFEHPSTGYLRPGKKFRLVNAKFIRETIGDFKGTELLKQPSKYAARLGQAFTATSPSVWISRSEFEEIEDIGSGDYLHTDGVGTISKSLSDAIWEHIKQPGANAVQSSAYQIRFLGYKGMVGVDPKLDEDGKGIKMRLRKSMKNFEDSKTENAPLEIAKSFQRPDGCHLNRPLIMFLEDLHVEREHFETLQDKAITDAKKIHNSISDFCAVLEKHSFGAPYRLSFTLKRLKDEYGLELHSKNNESGLDTQFLKQIRHVAMLTVLREIKHRAKISVPDSFHLVGVADEGPAYEKQGYDNVFTLKEAEIYACVQKSLEDQPVWLKGPCTISRSPIVHPGDIQRVFAIGKPPENNLCLFAEMKNVVVLPSVGKRSLASMLGGGDLDGDEFDIIVYPALLPRTWEEPAKYPQEPPLNLGRDSQVEDICNFIVEYFYSDVLGLLSVMQLIIADQSEDGVFDKDCLKLSRLCSQAVGYLKNGNKVEIEGNLPSTLIRERPDWLQAEVVDPRKVDYYESDRALGHLYRNLNLEVETVKEEPSAPVADIDSSMIMDPISVALGPIVEDFLGQEVDIEEDNETEAKTVDLFRKYVNELSYIRSTHTISARPDRQLQEAEIVVGTILDKCTQNRYRKDRMSRMTNHTRALVADIERHFVDKSLEPGPEEWEEGLKGAWRAWCYSQRHCDQDGAGSFGLIALGIVLDCLDTVVGGVL